MTPQDAGQLVEFRNYRTAPGAVDAFAEHFEARFLASQEALGMDIVGQLTPAAGEADGDRFVWVRRYLSPPGRAAALKEFYTGPVWKEFGPRANELMEDHTDVHLLVPDPSGVAFAADHVPHGSRAALAVVPSSTVVAAFFDVASRDRLPAPLAAAMSDALASRPALRERGRLVSASATNDFPALPVHEDAVVALWLLSASDDDGEDAVDLAAAVGRDVDLPLRTLRLVPTARSTLR